MSVEEDCVVNDGGGVLIFPVMGPGPVTTVTSSQGGGDSR